MGNINGKGCINGVPYHSWRVTGFCSNEKTNKRMRTRNENTKNKLQCIRIQRRIRYREVLIFSRKLIFRLLFRDIVKYGYKEEIIRVLRNSL